MKKMLSMGIALALLLTLTVGGSVGAAPQGGALPGHGFGQTVGSFITRVANFLGVEVATVREARDEGQTMADILGEENIDRFVALSVQQREAFLSQLIADGKITAEQAATCEADMEARIMERLTSTEFGLGEGVQQARCARRGR